MKGAEVGGRRGWRWSCWAVGVLIAVLLASATTSRNSVKIPLLGITNQICQCAESRKYTGVVEDCCCNYETVDGLNKEVLYPILQDLVTTPFFRYFKVVDQESDPLISSRQSLLAVAGLRLLNQCL